MFRRNQAVEAQEAAAPPRPVLDLSGPALTTSLEALVVASEADGGIEKLTDALKLKSALFIDLLGEGKYNTLTEHSLMTLCAFMSSVRRRVAPTLKEEGFAKFRGAIVDLFDGANDTATADRRIQRFCASFPQDKKHRWVRDMATELLHYTLPEIYPMMNRWIWDAQTNTGALREIWFADNLDAVVIDVSNDYDSFLVLREELSQFVTDNGVFQDVLFYVDLLLAQIYAGYISEKGGTYIRSDFSRDVDPLEFTRRLLGLDGIKTAQGHTRLKTIDGESHVLDELKYLEQG